MRLCSRLVLALVTAATACGGRGPAGPTGLTGPSGPPGSTAGESISAVTPARAFLARTSEVQITGFATNWSSPPTVDFGTGVTVTQVKVASPTGLLVTITVDGTAPLGPRNVTVTANGKTDTYAAAFEIASPLAASLQGTLAQGSILIGHASVEDLTTPLDLTQDSSSFIPTYPDLIFAPLSGFTTSVSAPAPTLYGLSFGLQADVNAATGPQTLELLSGPPGGSVDHFPLPNAFTLAPRDPVPLIDGLVVKGTLSEPYGSALYAWYPADASPTIVEIQASSTTPGAAPALALLPSSGKFADLILYAPNHIFGTTSLDPLYAVYWDRTGATGDHRIVSSTTPAAGAAFDTAATTKGTAQVAPALPLVITGGVLTGLSDQHWVKVTVGAGDVGKVFRVVTYPGDPRTDTLVDVQNASGTSLGGPSPDLGFHEDFTSAVIPAAGDYYVVISASPNYVAQQSQFNALIRLE